MTAVQRVGRTVSETYRSCYRSPANRASFASQQAKAEEFQGAIGHKLEHSFLHEPVLISVLISTINRISKFDQREICWDFGVAPCRNAFLLHPVPMQASWAIGRRHVDRNRSCQRSATNRLSFMVGPSPLCSAGSERERGIDLLSRNPCCPTGASIHRQAEESLERSVACCRPRV
jgi:hypothetical protein